MISNESRYSVRKPNSVQSLDSRIQFFCIFIHQSYEIVKIVENCNQFRIEECRNLIFMGTFDQFHSSRTDVHIDLLRMENGLAYRENIVHFLSSLMINSRLICLTIYWSSFNIRPTNTNILIHSRHMQFNCLYF